MVFKRGESFRHVLLTPIEVEYTFKADNIVLRKQGEILDISPAGIKFVTAQNIDYLPLEIDVTFVIETKTIQALGKVCWKKHHINGFVYGVELLIDEAKQELIISELKLRRKREVLEAKIK